MSVHALGVFDGTARVGAVEYESLEERFAFSYDPLWPKAGASYSISPHILMFGQPAASGTVRRFLENLLPEGGALDVVSTTHQVSKNNIYGLVRALGQETSGALSFLPEGTTPQSQTASRREVSREELKQRIDDRTHVPFAVWADVCGCPLPREDILAAIAYGAEVARERVIPIPSAQVA